MTLEEIWEDLWDAKPGARNRAYIVLENYIGYLNSKTSELKEEIEKNFQVHKEDLTKLQNYTFWVCAGPLLVDGSVFLERSLRETRLIRMKLTDSITLKDISEEYPINAEFLEGPSTKFLQHYADLKIEEIEGEKQIWSEASLKDDGLYNWVRLVKSERRNGRPYHSAPIQFLNGLLGTRSLIYSDPDAKSLDVAAFIGIFSQKLPWDPPECGKSAIHIAREGVIDLYYSRRLRQLIQNYRQDPRFPHSMATLQKWLSQEKSLREELDWL